jgi:hypothetical protein
MRMLAELSMQTASAGAVVTNLFNLNAGSKKAQRISPVRHNLTAVSAIILPGRVLALTYFMTGRTTLMTAAAEIITAM